MPLLGGRSASWLANISSNGRNLKSPFLTTGRHSTSGGKSASWLSANMSSNRRNLKSPFLITRCLYQGVPAGCSVNMSSNSRNVKSQFLTTRCLYWGIDLPVNWPIWALKVEISSHHYWPLDASTGGRSVRWLANMSSNSGNFKSPFLTH